MIVYIHIFDRYDICTFLINSLTFVFLYSTFAWLSFYFRRLLALFMFVGVARIVRTDNNYPIHGTDYKRRHIDQFYKTVDF